MPPSQLKQLKASLKDSGVITPQQSKKQKRQNAKTGVTAQNRNQRAAALQAIRDRFNPFEIKQPSRSKFEATTRDGNSKSTGQARPGVTKSLGEERRRATPLKEMNTKNKVGGLVDRRFGENDPSMTPEERAAERFARENQRKMRKDSMFNLEEDDDEFQLTHMGQSLPLDGTNVDDFEAEAEGLDAMDIQDSDDEASRKRKRFVAEDEEDIEDFIDYDGEDQPDRKKSKAEVMKEVIAKSKFYKHERQQAKDDDDDLRDELDKELPDLYEALRGIKAPAKPEPVKNDLDAMNPERAAMLQAPEKTNTEKQYDQRLKELTFDARSRPTDRTKTEEEKVEEEAERLKKLEEDRLKRMRGEKVSDDEEEEDEDSFFNDDDEEEEIDDAAVFGLPSFEPRPQLAVEDEDDFVIDDDLVETRSNANLSMDGSDDDEEDISEEEEESENEDELINGLTLPAATAAGAASTAVEVNQTADGKLAFTYPCPDNHDSFLRIVENVPEQDIPTVIQRIRALHHPRLQPGNKAKLGRFSEILVEYIAYLANETDQPSFFLIENILRHVHSLAKIHPLNVATAFRAHLREMSDDRPLSFLPGDLVILMGISTIFPTSDHFHSVTTPAHLCLARFLGQCSSNTLSEFTSGAFATSLCLQYQTVAKRYMPEFINYVLNAICNLAPTEIPFDLGFFPFRKTQKSIRLAASKKVTPHKLQFQNVLTLPSDPQAVEDLKISLITTFVSLLDVASDIWAEKSAFTEIFTPVRDVLQTLRQSFKNKLYSAARDPIQSTLDKVNSHLSKARLTRRPLLLHDHRPLAIKSAIPKFEENFNPDKHYDPDRERAETNRLKAEIKRERKGAMRELRKDASFVAREKLREKKERDSAYEQKYKKLIAEIQSEEGRAANEYEREKRGRGKK
ncbi:RRNA maturation protein (Nop14) [Penicillium taxi]|uniref:RRNA maturation protein (Nop14) n=1 Tax=Penicillium taxi TaxID=168475 RepID=UPI002544ECD4|nr:RRNA maturation protein (Nop14) [Penicillium taxi]KAJ5902403.1 RRNA maturation protein (Nop14) [Penicillium taxi]